VNCWGKISYRDRKNLETIINAIRDHNTEIHMTTMQIRIADERIP
jgi:hypothetical protein